MSACAITRGQCAVVSEVIVVLRSSWCARDRCEDRIGGFLATSDAIGYSDAAIRRARDCEGRNCRDDTFDLGGAIEMADFVLRHRVGPSPDFRDYGSRVDAEQFAELVAHCGEDLIVGEMHHRTLHLAADECRSEEH